MRLVLHQHIDVAKCVFFLSSLSGKGEHKDISNIPLLAKPYILTICH